VLQDGKRRLTMVVSGDGHATRRVSAKLDAKQASTPSVVSVRATSIQSNSGLTHHASTSNSAVVSTGATATPAQVPAPDREDMVAEADRGRRQEAPCHDHGRREGAGRSGALPKPDRPDLIHL